MKVDPEYAAIGKFFGHEPMFRVPKYQRSYAWERPEIEDFIKDLENCFNRRKAGSPVNHFFGSVVSVEKKIAGGVQQHEYELVDGQQRFATFVTLIAALIHVYKKLLEQIQQNEASATETIIEKRISKLTTRFIEFDQEVNRESQVVDVLALSKADQTFFRDMIRQNDPSPIRESHERLSYSYSKLIKKLTEITSASTVNDQLDNLEIIQQITDSDFSLLHIVTYDHKEAYQLFQVLNDRGKSLTEGDLLRAKTLEILEGFSSQQNSAESLWDNILMDSPKQTDDFLRWIYASFVGSRAGKNTLFDEFLAEFFSESQQLPLDEAKANSVLRTIEKIQLEVENARKIIEGSWPFPPSQHVTSWDRNRLSLLIRELGLTVTMPLLLAACHLSDQNFSKIVQLLERFLFRFKIVSNQHIGSAITVFHSQSVAIRNDHTGYNPNVLKQKLSVLQNDKANDSIFKSNLSSLSYKEGGGNKPIKYFIMTIEHYRRWFNSGASGEPNCQDKTRIYDFTSTTIEHIYPRNAQGNTINVDMESMKNTIANLTFMGASDNNSGANRDFADKKSIFENSSVGINQDISQNNQWTISELQQREESLKKMACVIFSV